VAFASGRGANSACAGEAAAWFDHSGGVDGCDLARLGERCAFARQVRIVRPAGEGLLARAARRLSQSLGKPVHQHQARLNRSGPRLWPLVQHQCVGEVQRCTAEIANLVQQTVRVQLAASLELQNAALAGNDNGRIVGRTPCPHLRQRSAITGLTCPADRAAWLDRWTSSSPSPAAAPSPSSAGHWILSSDTATVRTTPLVDTTLSIVLALERGWTSRARLTTVR